MSAKRNYSADLLRCILMVMITAHHAIVHGLELKTLGTGSAAAGRFDFSLFLMNAFCIVGVNAFFFISGYFSIKLKVKKIIVLYLEMQFYLLIWFFVVLLRREFPLISGQTVRYLLTLLFPINAYWFMGVYFLLCILSKYINGFIRALDSRDQKVLLIILSAVAVIYGFIFDWDGVGRGYTFIHGLYMYFLGTLCKMNKDRLPKNRLIYLGVYAATSLAAAGSAYLMYRRSHGKLAWHIYSYNDPLIILGAVSLCLFFTLWDSENIVARASSSISKYVLAGYLILVRPQLVFYPLLKFTESHSGSGAVAASIIVYSTLAFLLCIPIDMLRSRLFTFIGEKYNLEDHYENICDWCRRTTGL